MIPVYLELTRDEIDLLEIEGQVHQLFGFAVATAVACGTERPATQQMMATTLVEMLKLSVVHGEAEKRVAARIERRGGA